MGFRIGRIYDPPQGDDGYRVLVDRLWPRGVSRQAAELDLWLKEAAPSSELRRWFHEAPEGERAELFAQFAERYRSELHDNPAVQQLADVAASHPTVTLLTATRDEQHTHAVVLRGVLEERKGG